jgi:hypothetical protein
MFFFLEYLQLVWWLILVVMAFYLWRWAQEHLGFSPLMAVVVGAILIYFMVIEHPWIGLIGIGGWLILTSGFLLMAGMFFPVLLTLFRRR